MGHSQSVLISPGSIFRAEKVKMIVNEKKFRAPGRYTYRGTNYCKAWLYIYPDNITCFAGIFSASSVAIQLYFNHPAFTNPQAMDFRVEGDNLVIVCSEYAFIRPDCSGEVIFKINVGAALAKTMHDFLQQQVQQRRGGQQQQQQQVINGVPSAMLASSIPTGIPCAVPAPMYAPMTQPGGTIIVSGNGLQQYAYHAPSMYASTTTTFVNASSNPQYAFSL